MVYKRQSVEYKEKVVKALLDSEPFQAIVERHGFTDGMVRLWARSVVKEYMFSVIEAEGDNPAELKIDSVPVESLLLEFQRKRKERKRHGSYQFKPERYPLEPGCYLMKDQHGEVIYVGKAKSLRNRLSSYFQRTLDWKKTELLVGEIADIEIIIVNNESEALFLENNLIKLHQPRYNRRLLDDDSGYAYIVLTGEELPRLAFYRKGRVNPDLRGVSGLEGEKRFGPFLNAQLLLDIAMENFKLRTCAGKTRPKSVCLTYHLGKCSGICQGYTTPEEYWEGVRGAEAFLAYKPGDRINEMKRQMLECAERLEFEKAARLKKQITALQSTLEKQIVERDIKHNQDVVYFGNGQALITNIEGGMIKNMRMLEVGGRGEDQNRVYEEFLVHYFAENCPDELIVNCLSEPARVEKVLSLANGHKVKITLPKKGVKHDLLKLCERNYQYRALECAIEEEISDEDGIGLN